MISDDRPLKRGLVVMSEIPWYCIFLLIFGSIVLLGLVALLRCRREDIVKVIRELRRIIRK
ncbi:hypothetical protein U5640_23565 [Streptomyces sp. SS7]|uniref:hypothetical protein n=1 Tax=Streptomyces sp. SS7 TaxID=3108485 RepID=UPI0030EC28FC